MKRINIKGIKKKSTRFSLQISTLLGLFNPQVSDENYKRIEANYRFVEKTIRNFLVDVELYVFNLKCVLDLEKDIFTDVIQLIDVESRSFYSRLEVASNQLRSIDFLNYSKRVAALILNPLKELVNCYTGPNKLIFKRTDKLLDYESAMSDLELKTNNNNGTITSANYPKEVDI
jgi:hypothetical protein